MAIINKIKVGTNGSVYDLRDADAQTRLSTIQGDSNTEGSIAKAKADAISTASADATSKANAAQSAAEATAAADATSKANAAQSAAEATAAADATSKANAAQAAAEATAAADATSKANAAQAAAEATAANALSAKVGNLGTIAAVGEEGQPGYVAAHDATVKEYIDNAVNALAGEDWSAAAGTVKQIIDEIKGDDVAGSMVTLIDKLDTIPADKTVKQYVDDAVSGGVSGLGNSSVTNDTLTLVL